MSKKNSQGIVIGTKEEAIWTNVKTSITNEIANLEKQLIVDRALLKLAEEKILLEKRK